MAACGNIRQASLDIGSFLRLPLSSDIITVNDMLLHQMHHAVAR